MSLKKSFSLFWKNISWIAFKRWYKKTRWKWKCTKSYHRSNFKTTLDNEFYRYQEQSPVTARLEKQRTARERARIWHWCNAKRRKIIFPLSELNAILLEFSSPDTKLHSIRLIVVHKIFKGNVRAQIRFWEKSPPSNVVISIVSTSIPDFADVWDAIKRYL